MDKENTKYIRATVTRLNYLLNGETDTKGLVIQLLNQLGKEGREEERLRETASRMNLSLFEILSEKSLYKRRKPRKDFVSQLEREEDSQELSREECEAILKEGTSGVLALLGDGDYPYAVPLSYVYEDGKIYFHCAKAGHKLDAIRRQEKASFCVIGQDQILPEKFTTCFSSVIVFGKVRILEEEGEIRSAAAKLAEKYSPQESEEAVQKEIEKEYPALCMLELVTEHMSGKQGIELVREKERAKQKEDA